MEAPVANIAPGVADQTNQWAQKQKIYFLLPPLKMVNINVTDVKFWLLFFSWLFPLFYTPE